MRLSVKIAVYMVGIIAFALLLLTYLTNAKFRSLQEEVERSRFLALALDVKGTAERGLALGLGLEQMGNLAAVLARIDEDHPEILSLRVLDDQGDELFAAGRPLEPAATEAGLRHLRGPGAEPVLRDASGESAFGFMIPLVNTFGQVAGVVVLHYDRAPAAAAARQVTLEQLRAAGLALLLGGLVALVAATLYLRGVTRGFARMTRWAEEVEPAEPAIEPEGRADDLERRFLTVRRRAAEVEEMMARAESAAGRR